MLNYAGNSKTGQNPIAANAILALIYAFAYGNGSSYSVVMHNMDQTTARTVKFSGAHRPSGTVQMYRFAPTSATAINQSPIVNPTAFVAPTRWDTASSLVVDPDAGVSLPPASVTTFTWSDTTEPLPTVLRYQSAALQNVPVQ